MALDGQQLGRYRLLHLIGSGGMGEVYLAEDPDISRQIAIKVLRTEAAAYPETESSKGAARLFQREARAIAMLDHPRILPLFDYGEQQVQGARYTYMVMPYRQEGSLAEWLQQRGDAQPLSALDVEQIVQQAASALQFAHDHLIVHQDVKPSNFLLRTNKDAPNRPELLLADFGIAKLSSLTSGASQSIRGTPSYMAPEQWEGHAVPATDQYALAVMVYELLTGRPPFRGNPMQMMFAHVNAQPQAPSLLNPRISGQLDAVLLRALSKKPEERFPSVQAFAFAFREALRSIDPSTSMLTSGPDRSTFVKTPNTPAANELFATLAISEEEARTGSNRNLTLPGGRQVSVSIPAGARDGQVITLGEQGEPLRAGDTGNRLQLKLSIVRESGERMPPTLSAREKTGWYEDPTALANRESIAANTGTTFPGQNVSTRPDPRNVSLPGGYTPPSIPPSVPPAAIASNQSGFNDAGTLPYRGETVSTKPRGKRPTGSIVLLVLLVCLLIGGSVGLFYYFGGRGSGSPGGATSTTGTGTNNDATATAQAIATATAIAQQNATATAIAQQNATATAVAANGNPYPYPPGGGTLVLNDPLSDNSGGHQWQEFNDTIGNACQFTNGAYHVIEIPHYGGACFAAATDFSNFTYQVQMTFVRAGQSFDGGGIAIRSSGNNYYYFEIFESGRYVFTACTGNDCSHGLAQDLSNGISAFHTGLNQPNIIAITANGSSFDLYVNGQHIAGPVTDPNATSSHGMIGVYGEGFDVTTEIVYSDAKVWV